MQAAPAIALSSTALPQFLRGIGKRGYVLAEAQCGESLRAQQALATAIEEFRHAATHLPLAQWPEQFWQRLLAQPTLRTRTASRNQDDPLAHLSAGPRAALLLRLVAGLDNTHAAAVLRVSPAAYRQALHRALHVLHEQAIDEAALRALRGRLQQRVKALPEQFLQIAPAHSSPRIAARGIHLAAFAHAHRPRSRWLQPVLSIGLGVLALLFAATYIHRPSRAVEARKSEQLLEQPVAAKLSPVASALASPDFELLDDPDGERDARDLALLSWYDATAAAPASTDAALPALPESTTPETSAPDAEHSEGGQPGAP